MIGRDNTIENSRAVAPRSRLASPSIRRCGTFASLLVVSVAVGACGKTTRSHRHVAQPPQARVHHAVPRRSLISNSSFEHSTSGWRAYVTEGVVQLFGRSTRWAKQGRYSLALTAGHNSTQIPGRAEILTGVPVRPGCRYRLSAYVKLLQSGAPIDIEERISWEPVAPSRPQVQTVTPSGRFSVYSMSLTAFAPIGARDAEVGIGAILRGPRTVQLAFDAVNLRQNCRYGEGARRIHR
ncbi:MAG: carbohydrate binding domain-containing protein [Solirubrobacteraceae bacterium]